jgi:hypothetical protein
VRFSFSFSYQQNRCVSICLPIYLCHTFIAIARLLAKLCSHVRRIPTSPHVGNALHVEERSTTPTRSRKKPVPYVPRRCYLWRVRARVHICADRTHAACLCASICGAFLCLCAHLICFLFVCLQVAARASAFGVRLVATRSRAPPTPPPPGFAWVGGADDVDRLLEESDYVVRVTQQHDINDISSCFAQLSCGTAVRLSTISVCVCVCVCVCVSDNAHFLCRVHGCARR